PTGAFTITVPEPGDYLVSVQREGYYALTDRPVHIETVSDVTWTMSPVREVFQSVNVDEEPSPVDVAQTRNAERLTGTEINDIPYPNSHSLVNSMKLLPGVVEDPTGALHFNGSSENQVQYVLNGFNITDPISGQFQSLLAVEGIRSLDFSSARYSPEFGKGSAGVLAISTETGTDTFHFTTTDFIPGLKLQQGLHLGNWYPRVGFSGPVVRGKAWFSDTFDSEYNESIVNGLPRGENTRSGWAGSNLLHAQVNLAPSNILFADFLATLDNQGRVGLGPLDPISTTTALHTREYFASVKDQIYFGHGALIELGYAHNYFFDSQTPQGQALYTFSPEGRGGNYFVTSRQHASRDQWIANGFLPGFRFAGSHQIKAGTDLDHLNYDGNFQRTGYEDIGLSGQVLSQTTFFGPGLIHVPDTEASVYLLDTWRITKKLQVEGGVRGDWDRQLHDFAWSPRVSVSWAPFSGKTRISGGYAITRDAVTLETLGHQFDQSAITTFSTGSPALTTFAPDPTHLDFPRAANWSINVDRQITEHVYFTAKYLRRRTTDGFAFINTLAPDAPPFALPLPNAATGGIYELTNTRRDNYDAVQISVRQRLSGQYEWMLSYTRSRTVSNALLDYNAADPLQVLPSLVPVPWDTPNRALGWAYLPLPWKNWAVAVMADARSGYPFSIRDQTGLIAGGVDSHRYSYNFDLNLALERMFTFRGYRFALRGGVNNLTNSSNSTAVNNVIGSPQFLQFYGNEGRHFVARIRFFGRAGK
ncbi:MAG: hypothetical protein ABSB35_28025, partial [Bryobacteraceae bacterium]